MGMETTLKNSIMISIFVICIVTFSIGFAIDNDSDVSLASDTRFSSLNSTLRSDMDQVTDDANSSYNILLKTSLASGDQEISGGGGQFKLGPYSSMKMSITSLKLGFDTLLGPEFGFILIAFSSLMVFLIGYYVIKAWLGRDPN